MELGFEKQEEYEYVGNPKTHNFSPYTDNGGTTIAVSGKDFAVVACDTRLSEGYLIHTREQSKIFPLTDKTVLTSSGCWCDVLTFLKVAQWRIKFYNYDHRKPMSTNACAQMVSTMLYNKRFFPYYISNMVVGLDENGEGAVYDYDPVGSFQRVNFHSSGSSSPLIQPLLDNQLGLNNQPNVKSPEMTVEFVTRVVKDAFISAAERDIYCGDSVIVKVITKDGIKEDVFPLRKD